MVDASKIRIPEIRLVEYGLNQGSDPVREESPDDIDRVVRRVLVTCGPGRLLIIGAGSVLLHERLLREGVDAYAVDSSEVTAASWIRRLPGRVSIAPLPLLPYGKGEFNTILLARSLESLSADDSSQLLRELFRVAARFLVLYTITVKAGDECNSDICSDLFLGVRLLDAGFRKHPLYYQGESGWSRLNSRWKSFCFEKIPPKGVDWITNNYSRKQLAQCDMLSSWGSLSDALCIQYTKAASYIRPGDHVLHVTCALGYGSHILFANSPARSVIGVDSRYLCIDYAEAHYAISEFIEFRGVEEENMSFLPDHSVDFVVAFEVLEHVTDPLAYLNELKRVLRPGGRVVLSVRAKAAADTISQSRLPQRRLYTWERFVSEVGALFLLEAGIYHFEAEEPFSTEGTGKWLEVSIGLKSDRPPDWFILVAMTGPETVKDLPYLETAWSLPTTPGFNVTAFGRDYTNPWLVKAMVVMGMRMQPLNELVKIQERVLATYNQESVDYGAALCGRIYSYISEGDLPALIVRGIRHDVLRYASIPNPSPHQHRWQVSLLFAAGELERQRGCFTEAAEFYLECASRDVLFFSPLLGNKTLDSLFWLARFYLARNDVESARKFLLRSVREVERLLRGDWINIIGSYETPFAFGLAEASQLLDKAARAAYMLNAINRFSVKPYVLMQESLGFFERHLEHYKGCVSNLDSRVATLDARVANLTRLLSESSTQISYLNDVVGERDEQISYLKDVLSERDMRIGSFKKIMEECDLKISSLSDAVTERDAQITDLNVAIFQRDGRIASLNYRLEYARSTILLMERSRSWRLTRPLRGVNDLCKKLAWCLARFESVRRNTGLKSAVTRAIRFVKSKSLRARRTLAQNVQVNESENPLSSVTPQKEPQLGLSGNSSPVFMLVEAFHDGGVERVVIDLSLELREYGRTCVVLVANDGGTSSREARSHGIEVIEFKLNLKLLEQFISKIRNGIVLIHHCFFGINYFADANIPIIEVIHNAYHWQRGNNEVARLRQDFITKFVAVSQFVRDYSTGQLGLDASEIEVINNGLNNIDLIRPPLIIMEQRRLETIREPILLHVANLHPQKNHRLVVAAFARVKRSFPNAKLILAGAMYGYPELRDALVDDIETFNVDSSIRLVDVLDRRELSRTMADAHIGLLPSLLEGFSLVTLEFTFFGLPSVLSSTGAADELRMAYGHVEIAKGCALPIGELSVNAIEDAANNVSEASIISLTDKILELLSDYPVYLRKASLAAERCEDYSSTNSAHRYNELLNSLKI